MFFGRENELESLNQLYSKKNFGMSVIYGRRRIGKSTLITEFIKGKKAIFYTATKVGSERNFELFTRQVTSVLDPDLEDVTFSSLDMLFDYVTKKLSDEKLIKRRDLFKGILIGMYVVCVILIILLVYIFFNKGFSAISIASFIPVFMLPVITMPLYFQVTLLEKEVKARNLK